MNMTTAQVYRTIHHDRFLRIMCVFDLMDLVYEFKSLFRACGCLVSLVLWHARNESGNKREALNT